MFIATLFSIAKKFHKHVTYTLISMSIKTDIGKPGEKTLCLIYLDYAFCNTRHSSNEISQVSLSSHNRKKLSCIV